MDLKTKQALVRQAMRRLADLSDAQIETLAKKPGVKTVAVENFLGSLGDLSYRDAMGNLEQDARSYKWNAATKNAIRDGILKHYGKNRRAAVGTKTANQDIFFEIVDKRKWSAIRQALKKAGDEQSVGLWSEASLKLSKALSLSTNEEYALNRMKNLMERPTTDPDGMRNQVFKIANELGIRLPSGMFASTNKTATIRLPTKDGTRTTFSVDDVHVHVWFDAGVAKTDYGQHVPDSGEWQVIASTSPDPLNQRPRGRELARDTFRFADPRQRNAVYASAQQYVKRLLFKFRGASASKTAKTHRVGLPPYDSWRKFVDYVQLREMQNSTTPQTAIDLEHALRELRGYAAYSSGHASDLKQAIGAIEEALEIHNKQAQLARDFDKQMRVIHAALKKIEQL